MVNPLEDLFPGLAKGNYQTTSTNDSHYNCIAWAAGDTRNWWWPGPDVKREWWPPDVPREVTLAAFEQVFASLGYMRCETETAEPGFEKIALFATAQGTPKHAARQLPGGRWTSKLGVLQDIEHELRDLEGRRYGPVVLVMKRPLGTCTGRAETTAGGTESQDPVPPAS